MTFEDLVKDAEKEFNQIQQQWGEGKFVSSASEMAALRATWKISAGDARALLMELVLKKLTCYAMQHALDRLP